MIFFGNPQNPRTKKPKNPQNPQNLRATKKTPHTKQIPKICVPQKTPHTKNPQNPQNLRATKKHPTQKIPRIPKICVPPHRHRQKQCRSSKKYAVRQKPYCAIHPIFYFRDGKIAQFHVMKLTELTKKSTHTTPSADAKRIGGRLFLVSEINR
ncbi:MAG: hypothetical protein MJZ27_09150 [Bacteroidales bacterium]|nr:hypothetical protein [Bacteroidales bacterium]